MKKEANILSVPCQWDEESIDNILNFEMSNGLKVKEMYGTISSEHIPHGRAKTVTTQVTRERALEIKRKLDENGIRFAYLINAPVSEDLFEVLGEELEWIVNDFKADSITVSSFEFMKFIRSRYPELSINVSTITGVKNVEDIKKYLSVRPAKIVTHHDVNRNFEDLKEMISFTKEHNIKLEIMLNESCLRRCKNRKNHYDTLGKECDDRTFHIGCNSIKVTHPYQLIMANYIRPEDVNYYEELGIELFKVTGRSKPIGWLEEVVKAYLNRNYEGNIMNLLAIDPKLNAEKWIYIDNKALEGMLAGYPKDGVEQNEVDYCEKLILGLYQNAQFYMNSSRVSPQLVQGNLRFKLCDDLYV